MNPLVAEIEAKLKAAPTALMWLPHPVPGYAKRGMTLADYYEHAKAFNQELALRKVDEILFARLGLKTVRLDEFQANAARLGFQDTDNLCWYCLERLATDRDHFLPKSRGGEEGDNLIPACSLCNGRKYNSLISVWVPKLTVHVREGDQNLG